jgi:hypothetical protein
MCVPLCSMLSTIAKTSVDFVTQQFLIDRHYVPAKLQLAK